MQERFSSIAETVIITGSGFIMARELDVQLPELGERIELGGDSLWRRETRIMPPGIVPRRGN